MNNSPQTWSIITLCYNEEESVGKFVEKLLEVVKIISPKENEIIIVDDGSTDKSREIIIGLSEKYQNVKPVYHAENSGIGMALRSGYFNAKYENVCAMACDGQFNPNELIPHATFPNDNFLSFFRRENTTYSLFRNILSLFNKKINEYFLGINLKDINWVKAYKLESLKKLDLRLTSSLIESEICSKLLLLGTKCIEIESEFLPRMGGKSKGASLKIVFLAMKETLKLMWIVNNFKRKQ